MFQKSWPFSNQPIHETTWKWVICKKKTTKSPVLLRAQIHRIKNEAKRGKFFKQRLNYKMMMHCQTNKRWTHYQHKKEKNARRCIDGGHCRVPKEKLSDKGQNLAHNRLQWRIINPNTTQHWVGETRAQNAHKQISKAIETYTWRKHCKEVWMGSVPQSSLSTKTDINKPIFHQCTSGE